LKIKSKQEEAVSQNSREETSQQKPKKIKKIQPTSFSKGVSLLDSSSDKKPLKPSVKKSEPKASSGLMEK